MYTLRCVSRNPIDETSERNHVRILRMQQSYGARGFAVQISFGESLQLCAVQPLDADICLVPPAVIAQLESAGFMVAEDVVRANPCALSDDAALSQQEFSEPGVEMRVGIEAGIAPTQITAPEPVHQ